MIDGGGVVTVQTLREGLFFFQEVGMTVRQLAARTRAEYSRDLTDVVAFLEARGITESVRVRLLHLQQYQHELEQRGLAVSSRNRKTDAIKTFFSFLHEQDVLHTNPAEQLIPPPLRENEPRILTEDEYQRLLAACAHNARDRAIIVMYLQTGMRLSELILLTVGDIELPAVIDEVEGHTGFARITRRAGGVERVVLNFKVCAALIVYLRERSNVTCPMLFLSKRERGISRRRVQYLVQGYLEQIGIRDASVQTLRHTMAAHHMAQGTDLQVIQETLGISVAATEKYLSLAKKTARKALQEHAL